MFFPNTGLGLESTAPAQRRARAARRRLSPASNPLPSPPGWALGLGQASGQAGRRLSRCQDSEPPPGSPGPVPAHTWPPIKGRGPRVGVPAGCVCQPAGGLRAPDFRSPGRAPDLPVSLLSEPALRRWDRDSIPTRVQGICILLHVVTSASSSCRPAGSLPRLQTLLRVPGGWVQAAIWELKCSGSNPRCGKPGCR